MSILIISLFILFLPFNVSGEDTGLDIGDFDNAMREYLLSGKRLERSTKVLAALLNRAIPAYADGNYKRFYLYGGYTQAVDDFRGLKPTHVEDLETLIRGKVGDSTVIVNKKGPTVLTILREPKNTPMQADKYTTIEMDAIRYLEN